ncbi:MAG: DUF5916 domain-containing protein [Lentimicrobiaceae bacterium]|nr:DUF5916 domain-containing protein [Lentimicrobiaceae bacterium]
MLQRNNNVDKTCLIQDHNMISLLMAIFHTQYTPFSIFRQINLNFNQWTGWDFGGYNTYYGGNVNLGSQFTNYWWANGGVNIDGNNRDNSILRGGPSMYVPGGWNYWWSVSTDSRKKLTFDFNNSAYFDFDDWTHNYDFGIGISYRPVDALRFSLSPSYNINKSEIQYIDNVQYGKEERYDLRPHLVCKNYGRQSGLDSRIENTVPLTIHSINPISRLLIFYLIS